VTTPAPAGSDRCSPIDALSACERCSTTARNCFETWQIEDHRCCARCEHGTRFMVGRDPRPRPTRRRIPRGWTTDGLEKHIEQRNKVLAYLVGQHHGGRSARAETLDRVRDQMAGLVSVLGHAEIPAPRQG
jgi:hypothetical protein